MLLRTARAGVMCRPPRSTNRTAWVPLTTLRFRILAIVNECSSCATSLSNGRSAATSTP